MGQQLSAVLDAQQGMQDAGIPDVELFLADLALSGIRLPWLQAPDQEGFLHLPAPGSYLEIRCLEGSGHFPVIAQPSMAVGNHRKEPAAFRLQRVQGKQGTGLMGGPQDVLLPPRDTGKIRVLVIGRREAAAKPQTLQKSGPDVPGPQSAQDQDRMAAGRRVNRSDQEESQTGIPVGDRGNEGGEVLDAIRVVDDDQSAAYPEIDMMIRKQAPIRGRSAAQTEGIRKGLDQGCLSAFRRPFEDHEAVGRDHSLQGDKVEQALDHEPVDSSDFPANSIFEIEFAGKSAVVEHACPMEVYGKPYQSGLWLTYPVGR